MTFIYVAHIDRGCFKGGKIFKNLLFPDGEKVKQKILDTKNPELKMERISAYSLLYKALSDFALTEKEIDFDEKGRPFIENTCVDISISHTKNAVVVALTDTPSLRIGADIEFVCKKSQDVAEKFISRYVANFPLTEKSNESQIFFFELTNEGFKQIDNQLPYDEEAANGLIKWCTLEAALKCEGGGFSDLPTILPDKGEIRVNSGVLTFKEDKYVLAFAQKRK